MANVIKKHPKPPKKNIALPIFAMILCIAVFIFGFLMYHKTLLIAWLVLCVLSAAGFVLSVVLLFTRSDESASKWYGNAGENRTGLLFKQKLPNDYIVIQNAVVEYEGRKSEIDNIIIGKSGVFIVEVKNMKGKVFGNYEEYYWTQEKIDQYKISHKREFYSPVKQVGTHVYRLANYLRERGIKTTIYGAVYFINPQTRLRLGGKKEKIPVFTSRQTQKLINYVLHSGEELSDKEIQKIFELLR